MSTLTGLTSSLDVDKSRTVLVVIDLQKGISAMPAQPHNAPTVVRNAASLADAFRKNRMPVFLVHFVASEADRLRPIADQQPWSASGQQPPKDWGDFVPELGPKENDIVIAKKQWGAFYGMELDLQLRRRGLNTIVLCGISTNAGVESTARFAYEYGYQQIFAEDAMAARSAEEHNKHGELHVQENRKGQEHRSDSRCAGIEGRHQPTPGHPKSFKKTREADMKDTHHR